LFAVLVVLVMIFAILPSVVLHQPIAKNAAAAPNIVHVGQLSEIVVWNPLTVEMTEDYIAAFFVYSRLFSHDENGNGPVGDLALSYNSTVHPDSTMTTYINITHNAYFRAKANPDDMTHQLTARDVAYTFKLIQNNTGGTWNYYLENLTNIVAVDTYTVRIDTDYTKATLIDDLAVVPVIPMYIWNDPRTPQGRNPYVGMTPDENVGSGPFIFDSWLRGAWYKWVTAPNYHASTDFGRVVKVDGVLYTVYSNTQALALSMNQGTEDAVVLTGDANVYKDVLGGPGTKVHVIKQAVQEAGITDIAINAIPMEWRTKQYGNGNPLLLDPIVRKAIMMTLNKTYIVNNIMYGLATQADSVIQPGFWHHTITNPVQFDPIAAKNLLLANGYNDDDGNGLLNAGPSSLPVKMGWVSAGTELSGIRCQAPNTDLSWGIIAETWAGWAAQAGIGFTSSVDNEITMTNQAWYKADYDIWVWHWGWGPEPLGSALSAWLTSEIKPGGYNCQMPMGPWWFGPTNKTLSPTGDVYSAFDENFSLALKTLDKDDRKVIVDKLQQWLYDSYCENPPMYDLGLYGFTDYRYEGWGDWQAHPGRSVATGYGLLWLWFDLKPATNRSPFFNVPPDVSYDVLQGSPKTFTVTVSDPDGDSLLVNWTFGDGTTAQSTVTGDTTVPQVVTQTHTYMTLATGLKMYVSAWDHVSGHEAKIPSTVNVLSTPNLGPVVDSMTYTPNPPVYAGTDTTWTATAHDAESGTSGYGLKITWTWDDGTYTVHRVTTLADGVSYTDTAHHIWSNLGTYNVKVSVWDGFDVEANLLHNVSATQSYEIIVNTPPSVPSISAMDGLETIAIPCHATSTDADADSLTFTWDWGSSTYDVLMYPPNPGSPTTSTVLHTWATAGDYVVTVYVDDGQGHNVSSTAVAHILSGTTPVPPGSLILTMYPNPGTANNEVWVNISAADANEDALSFYVYFGDGYGYATASSLGGTSGQQYVNVSYTYTDAGTYTIWVYVNDSYPDGSHNVSDGFDIEIMSGNGPPTFMLQSSFTAYYNQTFSVKPITISDPDGDAMMIWYDWGDHSPMTMGNATYVGTHVYKKLGTYTINVSVDDGNGHNVTKSALVTVTDANLKPTIQTWTVAPVKAQYVLGETIWFNLTVKDLEGDPVNITIDFGDGTPTVVRLVTLTPNTNSSVVSFTHSFSEINANGYTVRVTVSDSMDHADMTWASSTAIVKVETKPGKGGISGTTLGIIVAVIAAIVILLAVLMMWRKKGLTKAESGGMEGIAPPEPPPPEKT
jgi:ABC-type transport system substrate-binding protein